MATLPRTPAPPRGRRPAMLARVLSHLQPQPAAAAAPRPAKGAKASSRGKKAEKPDFDAFGLTGEIEVQVRSQC